MKLMRTIFRNTSLPVAALLACAVAIPKSAEAVTLDIFLIADHTAPNTSSEVTTTTAYQFGALNGGGRATSATLVDDFTFGIGTAMSFASENNPSSGPGSAAGAAGVNVTNDEGETGAGTAVYVNGEISTWDNSGIPGTVVDADEQLDFGRNSSATFNGPTGGFTDLIIADLGGLNPFSLFLGTTRVFNGINRGLTNLLLGLDAFAATDGVSGATDQVWLFRWSETVTGSVQVLENDNRNTFFGERLQADYIGAASASTIAPSPVPGPASLPLLAGGLVLMGWTLRRKRR